MLLPSDIDRLLAADQIGGDLSHREALFGVPKYCRNVVTASGNASISWVRTRRRASGLQDLRLLLLELGLAQHSLCLELAEVLQLGEPVRHGI
jgi:hypothetical protein